MLLPGHSEHRVLIGYSLASAYLASGDHDKAAQWFQEFADSGYEHVFFPIRYVRSFYFLGKIHEELGDMDQAREYYQRFYDYWGNGDLDRERNRGSQVEPQLTGPRYLSNQFNTSLMAIFLGT